MQARTTNPYRPGFNQAPVVLAGRDEILGVADEALAVAVLDGFSPRPIVLVGARGVGKSVLLGEIGERAGAMHGWPHLHVEARADGSLLHLLGRRMQRLVIEPDPQTPRRRLQVDRARLGANLGIVSGEVDLAAGDEDGQLGIDDILAQTMARLASTGSGLVLTVDEAQLADRRELGELLACVQEGVPARWPLLLVLAGLPSLRGVRKVVTYLERAEWQEVGGLSMEDAVLALRGPASSAGRPMSGPAAELLAGASGGYPYAVQLFGHHAWRASDGRRRISRPDAESALEPAHIDLERGLFASRWEGASPREREYLAALAHLSASADAGGRLDGGDVARWLGRTPSEVSYLRDRLLKKGTITNDGVALRFAVPGMATWILRAT